MKGARLRNALNLFDYHYRARERMVDAVVAPTPERYTRDRGNSFSAIPPYCLNWARPHPLAGLIRSCAMPMLQLGTTGAAARPAETIATVPVLIS